MNTKPPNSPDSLTPPLPPGAAPAAPPTPPLPSSWATLDHLLTPVIWDWPGWLPRGFLTILASEPGAGKSTLALRLAATYIAGHPWPDGAPYTGPTGQVIWCESEAGHALNLERARRWQLDLSQILCPLPGPLQNFRFDNPEHQSALFRLARQGTVRLIVLDSLRGLRSYRREALPLPALLTLLADLARIASIPILLTHHLRKRTLADGAGLTPERLLGASVITQAARLIWALDTPLATEPDHRRLIVIKSNLARLPTPLGMRIHDHGLHFGPPPIAITLLDRACTFLQQLLASGPLSVPHITATAQAAGFTNPTIRRAKTKLAIHSIHLPGQPGWFWSLPEST